MIKQDSDCTAYSDSSRRIKETVFGVHGENASWKYYIVLYKYFGARDGMVPSLCSPAQLQACEIGPALCCITLFEPPDSQSSTPQTAPPAAHSRP